MSKGAVTNALQRALQQGPAWPLPAQPDEAGVEALIYRKPAPPDRYAQPDYALIHQEFMRKGVALQLLWEEYEKAHGQSAYRYSQFCLQYHEYRGKLARSIRQVHRAGEKVFID
jgi:transposase